MTPPPDLQSVTFERLPDEGDLAVYLALVPDSAGSGTVFSLTAMTAAPRGEPEAKALLESLDKIKAKFSVLDMPGPPNPVTMKPEPFNPATEVMIELGIAGPPKQGPVSFEAWLEDTVAAGGQVTVWNGHGQSWYAKGGKAWATVWVMGGAGTISPKARLSSNNVYGSVIVMPYTYVTGKSDKVTLHATSPSMTYILYGNFTLP